MNSSRTRRSTMQFGCCLPVPCAEGRFTDGVHFPARRAAISVLVLLVLVLLTGLIATQVRRVLSDRRQMRHEQLHLQTEHLALAGLLKAESAWRDSAEYTGETWDLPAGSIHQTNSASVEINLSSDGDCRVVARYPANADIPFQVTKTRRLMR